MSFRVICLSAILYASTLSADESVKTEIIDRCKSQMGEYGASMVKSCVDQDLAAVEKIQSIDDEHKPILDRCMGQMREYGYSMVKSCVDQDLSLIHISEPTRPY